MLKNARKQSRKAVKKSRKMPEKQSVGAIAGKRFTCSEMLKNFNGQPIADSNDKIEAWAAYFGSLLNNSVKDSAYINPLVSDALAKVDDSAPSIAGVTSALKTLKTSKAAGTDQLPPELFKFAADELALTLSDLFGKIWRGTDIQCD